MVFSFLALQDSIVPDSASFIGWIVYKRAIVYNLQKFLKVVVHVIIIDQCNQTAR